MNYETADLLAAINRLGDRIGHVEGEIQGIKENKGSAWNRASVVIAALMLIIGIMGTLLLVAEWKGDISARVRTIEVQRDIDRQTLDYIRTQGEVNGKSLARIEARVETKK